MLTADFIFLIADRIGVFVFAITGGIVGARRQMDLFGVTVLALLPAIGGGTLRDLILDQPVFWLTDSLSLVLAVAGGLVAFLFHRPVAGFRPLRWADAMGLALFAVTGAAKAAGLGHNYFVVVIMGVITATAGGVVRDVIAGRESFLMQNDIYATAALLGASVYFVLQAMGVNEQSAFALGFAAGFSLRALALLFNLSLPKAKG